MPDYQAVTLFPDTCHITTVTCNTQSHNCHTGGGGGGVGYTLVLLDSMAPVTVNCQDGENVLIKLSQVTLSDPVHPTQVTQTQAIAIGM